MFRSRPTIYWTCQVVGWFGLEALLVVFRLYGATLRYEPWRIVIEHAVAAVVAIGWSHVYREVIRRRRWLSLGPVRLLPRVIGASTVTAIVIVICLIPVWVFVFGVGPFPLSVWLPPALIGWIWGVILWSMVYIGVHYFERWRQAELEKLQLVIDAQDAQLHSLMVQLQPHFLFNCLNSVRALIVEDPAKAQATVTALSRLLRHSLQAGKESTVPLSDEIEMVRTYLELEAVRFEERLVTDIDVAPETAALHVPAMLVQSLVENGVKHGIEQSSAGGTIRVASWREPGALRVRVTNPGRIGVRDDSTRIGLANARARLKLLYGDGANLGLSESDRTVVADVSIPITEASA